MRQVAPWIRHSLWRAFAIAVGLISIVSCIIYTTAPEFVRTLTNLAQIYFLNEPPVPCLGLDKRLRSICWNKEIHSALKKSGIMPALILLETFSRTFPDFANECHSYAHIIGEEAYGAFRAGTPLSLSPAMQLCDFGFFHGFMTTFTTESRDPREMRTFCSEMEGTVSEGSERSYSRNACFHGIGHGSVERHTAEEWNDPDAVLRQTLQLCHAAAPDERDYKKCAGGAYDGIAHGTYGREVLDPHDPFKLCRNLTDEDVPAECYSNIASIVFNFTKHHTLEEAIALTHSYGTMSHFEYVIGMFAAMSAREENSPESAMAACGTLPAEFAYHCLWGYVSALVQVEVPDSKQVQAYALCSSDLVPDTLKETCFVAAFSQLTDFWSKDKIASSCSLTPLRGRAVCKEALDAWSSKNTSFKLI